MIAYSVNVFPMYTGRPVALMGGACTLFNTGFSAFTDGTYLPTLTE